MEVLVALVIGGIAVGAAAALFNALSGQAASVRRLAAQTDARYNGEHVLRDLFQNLEFRSSTAAALVGNREEVRLATWCDGEADWLVPCTVKVSLHHHVDHVTLDLEITPTDGPPGRTSGPGEIRRGGRGELRYLLDPARGGQWTGDWSSRVPPKAVAIVIDQDTLFFAVGGNG